MHHRLILPLVLFAVGAAAPSTVHGSEVRLQLVGPAAPLEGQLVVRAGVTSEETVYPLQEIVEVPAPPAAAARVTCRGAGLWCPDVRLAGDSVTLPVFSTVTVTGKVAGPGAGAALTAGTLQGVVRTDAGEGPDGTGGIELRQEISVEEGAFTFTAPRAHLDLRFAFAGAAPVYRWGLEPPAATAASTLALGTLTLHPGASLSGWTRSREDELPLPGARVTAFPAAGPDRRTPPLHTWTAASDERGFFQIHGLQAGSHRLEISAEGHVPQVLEAVEVEPGSETLIGTVLLSTPLRVTVQLAPPRHPSGAPWTVLFSPVRRLPDEERIEVRADPSGLAEAAVLRPAEYYLKVQSPQGEVLLFETRSFTVDEWLRLEVPVVAVEGTVRLGGEPLAATVKLEAGEGDRVEIESDEDGVLAGWMRRPERPWLMATVSWREAGEQRQRLLEVVPTLDDESVALEIDLPAGAVFGEVVDGEGRPQPRFRVVARPADAATRFTEVRGETDATGRFHLTGLDSTRYLVQAGGRGWPSSEVVAVDLADDLPAGEVRLVVWPTRKLALQVSADGQAVADAGVLLDGFGRVPVSTEARTDARGRVELDVPEDVARAVITVVAPSRLLWSGCVVLDGEEILLPLPSRPPGTLSLTLVGRTDLPPVLGGETVLLTGDGGFVGIGILGAWNRQRGAERRLEQEGERGIELLRLPGLAAGSYALTWSGAPRWELAARACAGAFPDAEWVALPPGGEAGLEADSSGAQARRLRELTAGRE